MPNTRRATPEAPVKDLDLDNKEEGAPQCKNNMNDLPPEVLTIILESLALDETNKTTLLSYRLVNHQWKEILDSIIEKKIVCGQFQVFQGAMKIIGGRERRQYDNLWVCTCPTVVQVGGNSFPLNSLLLTGKTKAPDFYFHPAHPFTPMTLPFLASTFGGNLTSFAIQDQVIPINTLATMLASMPRLKLIKFANVKNDIARVKPGGFLSETPPLLTSLTTLEMNSTPTREKNKVLYIWLIASYADQLERLSLETYDPFRPLRTQHQYSILLPKDKTFKIATTSDAAFGKLKELKVSRPTGSFLNLSETPSLRKLSIIGLTSTNDDHANIRNLIQFVIRCGGTLQKLSLDVSWEELLSVEAIRRIHRDGQLLPAGTTRVLVPKLKTLEIHYPSVDFLEIVLSHELLVMFPALELLQLLHFNLHDLDREISVEEMNECGDVFGRGNADPAALKVRSALLRQQMCDIELQLILFRREAELQAIDALVGEQEAAQMRLAPELEELDRAIMNAREEREEIFRRLAAFGESREKVVVEQLLERRGIWRTCPNLKIVSVSSGGKREEDICVIRRQDGA